MKKSNGIAVLLIGLVMALAAIPPCLLAQDASVRGIVLRRGVVPMSRAHVTYANTVSGAVYETQADDSGRYQLTAISLSVPRGADPRRTVSISGLVTNSVGASRAFLFSGSDPLREAVIYDLLGRVVAAIPLSSVPIEGAWLSSGFWDGRSRSGTPAASGVYFVAAADRSGLRTLRFVHVRGGIEAAPLQITESLIASLRASDGGGSEVPAGGRTSLDEVEFTVQIVSDTGGPRFAERMFSRPLVDGDNGVFADTVWSAPPHRVLFVGNSYTYYNGGLNVHVDSLMRCADPAYPFTAAAVAFAGYTLADHWRDSVTHAAIDTGRWDLVVLQEQSTRPVSDPDSMFRYARLLNAEILATGAETAFFMTWARAYDPGMIEGLAAAYNRIGNELGAYVSPVGRAWQRSLAYDSTLRLHESDDSHPNVWGTYLSACVFFGVLKQESPVGLSYVNDPLITEQQRLFLQTVAWETVERYPPWATAPLP
jgi:hypothetical protein